MDKEETKNVAWFELPFYRSLTEQILFLGAPRSAIMVNALIAFLFIINFHFWYILPINLLFHFGCIYVAKNDDQFFDWCDLFSNEKLLRYSK